MARLTSVSSSDIDVADAAFRIFAALTIELQRVAGVSLLVGW